MFKYSIVLPVLLMSAANSFAQSVSSHAKEAVHTIQQLRAIGIPSHQADAVPPPPSVPPLLRKLNESLKGLILESVNDSRLAPNQNLMDFVCATLRQAGWIELPPNRWNAYGEIIRIDRHQWVEHEPRLMTVTTHLWLPSESVDPDCFVYVFRKDSGRWALVLQAEADYDPREGERDASFRAEISPPDEQGGWFLFLAHSPPLLRGRNSFIKYKILRPGSSSEKPVVLLEKQEPWDVREGGMDLEVSATGFKLTRTANRWLDGDVGKQNSFWRIFDNRVLQLGPLADTPEDFLDYWLQLPWEEAATWSEPGQREDLEKWHLQMSRAAPGFSEIRFVQRCLPKGDSWQIGIAFDQTNEETLRMKEVFVTVGWKGNGFVVQSFDRKRPLGCPGEMRPGKLAKQP